MKSTFVGLTTFEKSSGCVNGDVRITREKYPQIYWYNKWNYICHKKFSGNNNGVELFCKKLLDTFETRQNRTSFGKILPMKNKNSTLTSKNFHLEDTFLMGSCKINDTWPHCTGGCNSNDLGKRCYQTHTVRNKTLYYSCKIGEAIRFSVQCSGDYDLPISSCIGIVILMYL